jgi:hypothetical protein
MARRYTDLQLACAVAESKNISDVLRRVGLVPRGANYATVKQRIAELKLDTHHLRNPRGHREALDGLHDAEFAAVVRRSSSIADVLRAVGLPLTSSTYKAVHARVAEAGIDTSHFTGQAWLRGGRR